MISVVGFLKQEFKLQMLDSMACYWKPKSKVVLPLPPSPQNDRFCGIFILEFVFKWVQWLLEIRTKEKQNIACSRKDILKQSLHPDPRKQPRVVIPKLWALKKSPSSFASWISQWLIRCLIEHTRQQDTHLPGELRKPAMESSWQPATVYNI